MKRILILATAFAVSAIWTLSLPAQQCSNCQNGACQNCPGDACCNQGRGCHKHGPKHGNPSARYRASQYPWHGNYYYTQWGAPVALVVPPRAEYQSNYSWGVPATRVTRIDHQFQHGYPGASAVGGYGFLPTPQFPNDTNNFGVYYVRGPW